MTDGLRYHPGADQCALADTFNESIEALLPLSRLHRARQESDETWLSLHSLGLFGIAVDAERGGSALGAVEEVLIVTALGRCLATPALIATLGAVHGVSPAGAGPVPSFDGRRVAAAYRSRGHVVVLEEDGMDAVLLRDREHASVHSKAIAGNLIDETLWHARLCDGRPTAEPLARFDESGLGRLRLIDAAFLAGIADAALRMAVDYAGQRRQFGRAIGSFQAVKHHCADMAIAARRARDQVGFAAVAVDDRRPDAPLQVGCALHIAGAAALENAGLNIQIHGGFGFSDEADPHLLLKRAQVQIALAGGLEAAGAYVADAASHA